MLFRQRTLLAICSIAFSLSATSAFADVGDSSENPKAQPVVATRSAKVVHTKRKAVKVVRSHQTTAAYSPAPVYSANPGIDAGATQPAPVVQTRKAARAARSRAATAQASASASTSWGSSSLVSEARRYLGTNPTNRRSLWCGAFMDMVLRKTGHQGGGNLARGYASYGRRISGPQVGAIAVMSRGRGGGHVGVVSGIDEKGNVIVVSGNHNNTVAESVYPRGRIYAYVMPNS